MRQTGKSCTLLVAALLAGCTPAPETAQPGQPAFYTSLAAATAEIDPVSAADLINGYRRSLGLPLVRVDPQLMGFARQQAALLAASDRVDATRSQPLTARLADRGLASRTALENVSAGYHTMSDAFSGWRGSPRHDATLRMAGATRFGIATAYNPASKYKVYWALVMVEP